MLPKITVMILPVGSSCNLSCGYCYHENSLIDRKQVKVMPLAILEKVIKESQELAKNVDFLWHGGEPLLAGLDLYQKAIDFQKSVIFKGNTRNITQTNAVLINDDWVNFFIHNNFLLSVSIDGPEHLHNKNRYNYNRQGTFSLVINGVKKVINTGRNIGVIAVVTTANVKYPDEVYNALKSTGAKTCAFHLCSANEPNNSALVPSDQENLLFFKRVFDLWLKDDDPQFLIRNFRNVLRVLFGGRPLDCASNYNHCRKFIAVTQNGDVYPCHRFVNESKFKLGNISEQAFSEIYEKANTVYNAMANISQECFRCRWFKLCGGGCAFERFAVGGEFSSRHSECGFKQRLFSYIEEKIDNFNIK